MKLFQTSSVPVCECQVHYDSDFCKFAFWLQVQHKLRAVVSSDAYTDATPLRLLPCDQGCKSAKVVFTTFFGSTPCCSCQAAICVLHMQLLLLALVSVRRFFMLPRYLPVPAILSRSYSALHQVSVASAGCKVHIACAGMSRSCHVLPADGSVLRLAVILTQSFAVRQLGLHARSARSNVS